MLLLTQTRTRRLGFGRLLLTEVLGCVDHMGESALDLIPLTGLQAAVWTALAMAHSTY